MANLRAREAGALDGIADLVDVVDNGVGISTDVRSRSDALGAVAVEVLASDGDSINDAGEIGAVLLDGACKGSQLALECRLTTRSPETEQQRSLGVDGSLDG